MFQVFDPRFPHSCKYYHLKYKDQYHTGKYPIFGRIERNHWRKEYQQRYPDLKANQNFLQLQQALGDIESDLGNSRRYYNATVRDYNTGITQFPGVVIANMTGFTPREFFELDNAAQAQNVEVKF